MTFYISSVFFCLSVVSFIMWHSHTLNLLVSLEAIMLSLIVFLYSFSNLNCSSSSSFLVLLTFAACEAALGLSLLVSLLRVHGNDLISTFSSMNFFA